MKKTRVLICGATGFIGTNITRRLANRTDLEVHAVRLNRPAYSCSNVIWHQVDLRDAEKVDDLLTDMDVVIQAAATTSGSKDIVTRAFIHVTDNAVMNSYLLRSAYEKKVKHFIFFSCTVMYQSSDAPLSETDFDANRELHPRYFGVGWTKVYIEKMCEFFSRIGSTKHTVICHSNIYGPYDKFDLDRSHVFGATITKVMTASDKVTVWGSGNEARDLLYVDDLADFVECSMDKQVAPYGLYTVGAGHAVTIKDLVGRIVAASGKNIRIEHDLSQPTIKTSLALDCSKAKAELGWQSKTDLDTGIARTIAWWRDNYGARPS